MDFGESPGSNAVLKGHAFRRAGRMKFISTVIPSGAVEGPAVYPVNPPAQPQACSFLQA